MTTVEALMQRVPTLSSQEDLEHLRQEVLDTENTYRELFARQRDSWEIPEIDDPYVYLVNPFSEQYLSTSALPLRRLPLLDGQVPRCFELGTKRAAPKSLATVPSLQEFLLSFDCLTESLLRHMDWSNVFCAGGAVAGCLAPLPTHIATGSPAATRMQRRTYFHEKFLPGSDIDLFLYGLTPEQGLEKLHHIYEAVQAANPYPVRCFRSKHAITLVSQYPFRHVQIVLRLYNSPSEVLMGFDVDACGVGFDGSQVWCCPRTAVAMMSQSNTVDPSRRSPSYEMRLAKYAERGFDVLVPSLQRTRVDPFLFEKRFDQAQGLARLLLLERLRTPEERFRYRMESQVKGKANQRHWERMVRRRINERVRQCGSLHRAEEQDMDQLAPTAAEHSNYSTIFLPWGAGWNAAKIERVTRKKDRLLNSTDFSNPNRVRRIERSYKMHLCAVGTMEEVIRDPFPNDPPLPDDLPQETKDTLVFGPVSWLTDNPGRQQIGSFHPINDDEWTAGAYYGESTEALMKATIAGDIQEVEKLLQAAGDSVTSLLNAKDFLGRTVVHTAILANVLEVFDVLLKNVNIECWCARTSDGRMALHLACLHNRVEFARKLLEKRQKLVDEAPNAEEAMESMDIDTGDWEVRMSPLHYSIVLGHYEVAEVLLEFGANARKIAIHKDHEKSESSLSLLAIYAEECGSGSDMAVFEKMAKLLLTHGASPLQVDTAGTSCWHRFASCFKKSSLAGMKILLELDRQHNDGSSPRGLDVMDYSLFTPVFTATALGNAEALKLLIQAGASPCLTEKDFDARIRQFEVNGKSFHQYRYGSGDPEYFRCPLAMAVSILDVECISVFLERYPNLAKTLLKRPGNRFLESSGEKHSILDILETYQTLLTQRAGYEEDLRSKARQQHYDTEARAFYIKMELDRCTEGSYEYLVWKFHQDETERSHKSRVKSAETLETEKEEESEAEKAKARYEEARKLIVQAGGTSHIPESERDNQDNSVTRRPLPESPMPKPFQEIWELRSFNFYDASNERSGWYRARQLAEPERLASRELLTAISSTNVGALDSLYSATRMCSGDSCFITPLFFAVWKGNQTAVERIYEEAIQQHARFVTKKLQEQEDSQDETKGDETSDDLKSQLRRLNNLDIASGETPSNNGPDREVMRKQMEAAEKAAAEQGGDVSIFSDIPPEFLLLERTKMAVPLEPKLKKLKQRLHDLDSRRFTEKWLDEPVNLRPVELAVVRGDKEMTELLLSMALLGPSNRAVKKDTDLPVQAVDERVEYDSEDEDGSDYDYEVDSPNVLADQMEGHKRFLQAEMRFLLTSHSSGNRSLGGMNLVQLAVLSEDEDILSLVLKFGRESTLPQCAIAAWKSESDSSLAEKRTTETILGSTYSFGTALPMWSSIQGPACGDKVRNSVTVLQSALAMDCQRVSHSILAGQFTDIMVGWLNDKTYVDQLSKVELPEKCKGVQTAATWLASRNASAAELECRLIQVPAIDSAGRNALFYAKADTIENLILSGQASLEATGKNTPDSKAVLLQSQSTKGFVTPLILAISTGNVPLLGALLKAGFDPSVAVGPNSWNAVHFGVTLRMTNDEDSDVNWDLTMKVLETILSSVSPEKKEKMLFCPEAEHTPLMLAASRSVADKVLLLLLRETSDCVVKALSRRDKNLNTIVHIATKQDLVSKENSLSVLLKNTALAESALIDSENSKGWTPVELSLQSIAMIWNKNKRVVPYTSGSGRDRRGIVSLPRERRVPESDKTDLPSHPRVAYSELLGAAKGKGREFVSFQDVQKSRERDAQGAKEGVAKALGHNTSNGDTQNWPLGPPCVWPK